MTLKVFIKTGEKKIQISDIKHVQPNVDIIPYISDLFGTHAKILTNIEASLSKEQKEKIKNDLLKSITQLVKNW